MFCFSKDCQDWGEASFFSQSWQIPWSISPLHCRRNPWSRYRCSFNSSIKSQSRCTTLPHLIHFRCRCSVHFFSSPANWNTALSEFRSGYLITICSAQSLSRHRYTVVVFTLIPSSFRYFSISATLTVTACCLFRYSRIICLVFVVYGFRSAIALSPSFVFFRNCSVHSQLHSFYLLYPFISTASILFLKIKMQIICKLYWHVIDSVLF